MQANFFIKGHIATCFGFVGYRVLINYSAVLCSMGIAIMTHKLISVTAHQGNFI